MNANMNPSARRNAMNMTLDELKAHKHSDGPLDYPPNITEAAERERQLVGEDHAPGAKQHVMVRKALDGRDPIEASGFPVEKLYAYARGELPREQSRKFRQNG